MSPGTSNRVGPVRPATATCEVQLVFASFDLTSALGSFKLETKIGRGQSYWAHNDRHSAGLRWANAHDRATYLAT